MICKAPQTPQTGRRLREQNHSACDASESPCATTSLRMPMQENTRTLTARTERDGGPHLRMSITLPTFTVRHSRQSDPQNQQESNLVRRREERRVLQDFPGTTFRKISKTRWKRKKLCLLRCLGKGYRTGNLIWGRMLSSKKGHMQRRRRQIDSPQTPQARENAAAESTQYASRFRFATAGSPFNTVSTGKTAQRERKRRKKLQAVRPRKGEQNSRACLVSST